MAYNQSFQVIEDFLIAGQPSKENIPLVKILCEKAKLWTNSPVANNLSKTRFTQPTKTIF